MDGRAGLRRRANAHAAPWSSAEWAGTWIILTATAAGRAAVTPPESRENDQTLADIKSGGGDRESSDRMHIKRGLYDLLVTETLTSLAADRRASTVALKEAAGEYLTDALSRQLAAILEELPASDDAAKLTDQVALVNGLLINLRKTLRDRSATDLAAITDPISIPPRILRAFETSATETPETGLVFPWLFTAAKNSPSLLQELRRELSSSDHVDILVSFITVSGVRKLRDLLAHITAVGASGTARTNLRILTTTYTGATEQRALDELARLPGCEVRVSLDGRRTRLHAKTWIFRRDSGFGSVYIGSANLSGAALTGGLEWTVKLTERADPAIFQRALAHFETLWEDVEFEQYDPDDSNSRQRLRAALDREIGEYDTASPVFFSLQPKNYQQEMLEALASERAHGRTRSLVVAATGTGKTIVAAFDYERTCRDVGGRPRLLFVAHREEILKQALATYRQVLHDNSFGEVLAGGREPVSHDHLFATIDSVTSRRLVDTYGSKYWHTVVIDECHRIASQRFDQLARMVHPQRLLGLTATPERTDGAPIFQYFDARPDGRPAVELRLWHALDLQLLAPFEYYGCDDETDFRDVPWDRSGERDAIDKLVTGNNLRARLVVQEWKRFSADATKSKALVFCVSVAHAEFMTEQFNRAGLPAACVVGSTPRDERTSAPNRLKSGELCAIVTVDLYNEGVDIPEVDTVLLLRPTQSPVLFQQQIGRGLRLVPNKESCLILDFVGQLRADFRFDRLLGSLTGLTRRQLQDSVEHGFGLLPPGCHIQLQKQTREQVLRGLREVAGQGWIRMIRELQAYVATTGKQSVALASFVHDQGLELEDVYRDGTVSGWTNLRRRAGLLTSDTNPDEEYLSRRLQDVLHMDDPRQIATLASIASNDGVNVEVDPIRAQMVAYQIDSSRQAFDQSEFRRRLALHVDVRDEVSELAAMLEARCDISFTAVPGLDFSPLCLHASYSLREILTAVGWLDARRRMPFRAGVLRLPGHMIELLFVTLDKSDGYHARIAYKDYAISRELFHWQSQNTAAPDTEAGRRYLESPDNGWHFQLFVRRTKGTAYRVCGPVVRVSAEGERPMNLTWRLAKPLPARLFSEFSVLKDN